MSLTKIFLIIFAVTFFQSCKSQSKSDKISAITDKDEVGKIVTEIDNQIWEIFQDSNGDFWFGSNGTGIYLLRGDTLKQFTTKDGLVDNQIRGIQEDKKGNVYFETHEGISKFNGKEFITLNVINSISNEWKLEPDDLWFGYNANDLYRYDGDTLYELNLPRFNLMKAFDRVVQGVPFEGNNNSPYAVFGVDQDKEGNVWFGTATAGAFRYDGKSFLWFGEKELSTLPDGRVPGVRSMIQDKDGYFWLSNFYSKYNIAPGHSNGYEKMKAVDLPQDITKDKILYFNSGIVDQNGDLWMTTYGGGVWRYDGKSLSNFAINNGKEDVLLICIFQDRDGIIWLGTNNDGVYTQTGDGFEKFEF